MIFVLATSIFAVLYFTKPCSCPVFTKQESRQQESPKQNSPKQNSPKQESPCPEQSKYENLDCTSYKKYVSEIMKEEIQRCAKITSENDCIKNNLCYWGSKGERLEMITGDTPEEIRRKYSNSVYEKKSCNISNDGQEEITWRHGICTKDSNSDSLIDMNELLNDPEFSKASLEGNVSVKKIFNEVKGSDNKLNRCEYKKFSKKIFNEMTKMRNECKKLNKNFDSTSYKCIDKPEEGK